MRTKLLLLVAALAFAAVLLGCEPLRSTQPPANGMIAFTAKWCAPCRRDKPVLESIDSHTVVVIDIDTNPQLARSSGVTTVPTYIVFIDGKERLRTSNIQAALKALK